MIVTATLRKLFDVSLAYILVGALGLFSNPATAGERHSAVYCLRGPENSLEVFALRVQPKGRLKFGISIWNERQHNLLIYGFADRLDGHWEYADHMGTDDRCKLTITLSANGTAHIVADPEADCENRGGVGTAINAVHFPKSADEGPVTFELSDSEAFVTKAGKC